jgi:hypothetical protein
MFKKRKAGFLSKKAVRMRRKNPTTARCENLGKLTIRKRCQETMSAALEIHGGSQENQSPGTVGLLMAMEARSSVKDLAEAISSGSGRKFRNKILPKVHKQDLGIFESSTENMLRSIALYYSKGVMGKVKYRSVCKALAYRHLVGMKKAVRIKVVNCPIPKLAPCKLMSYIKSIDIGKLYSVRETLCEDLEDREKVNGCYRNLEELLLKLAQFYLCNDFHEILTFGALPYTFYVALGGDGAPFGKDDSSCSWLVSILNIGKGVLSNTENFFIVWGPIARKIVCE